MRFHPQSYEKAANIRQIIPIIRYLIPITSKKTRITVAKTQIWYENFGHDFTKHANIKPLPTSENLNKKKDTQRGSETAQNPKINYHP